MGHRISVITDEVSPDLETALRFAVDEGLDTVDVRSVGGVNLLSLERDDQRRLARKVRDAGLAVGCFATPLLKWPNPGRASANHGDQFGFDARGRSTAELFDDAFAAAEILGTKDLRIFSLLTYEGFEAVDLEPDLTALLERAERLGMTLHLENEPVCNIASVADLTAVVEAWNHPRLKALLDIGNATSAAKSPPGAETCVRIMPWVEQLHFKDWSARKKRIVALGEGDVPYGALLRACFAAARGRSLALTVETHVPDDQPGATRRSLAALRRLAGSA